jgi:hypothetical protein
MPKRNPAVGVSSTPNATTGVALTQPAQQRAITTPARKAAVRKATQEEMEERREKVLQMRLRGLSFEFIAANLGVSAVTVKRDYEAARESAKGLTQHFDKHQFLGETIAGIDDVIARAYEDYAAAQKGTTVSLKALDLIRVARADRVRIMTETGIIEKKPERVEQKISLELIHGWNEDVRKAAVDALLSGMLKTKLLEPIPDANIIDVTPVTDAEIVADTSTQEDVTDEQER